MKNTQLLSLSFALIITASSCRSDNITSYKVPTDTQPSTAHAAAPGQNQASMPVLNGDSLRREHSAEMAGAAAKAVAANPHEGMSMTSASKNQANKPTWTKPASWEEKPTTTLRVGNFEITGKNGQKAQISVVPLNGTGGGEAANVNLWRSQVGLAPVSDAEALALMTRQKFPAGEFGVVDLAGKDPLIEKKYKAHIVAAMQVRGDSAWFFKLMGEDETVAAAKQDFLQFLGSVKFNDKE